MKKLILMLMLLAPVTMFAQAKFGHIDSQAFLESLPEAMAIQKSLQAKGEEYQKNLKSMQDELESRAKKYDAEKSTMSATQQEQQEKELQDMYTKIQQTAQDNQKAFNEEQQKQLGPIIDKVRTAIENVAKAGKYVYIMEKSTAVGQPIYINEALSEDVTSQVKIEYNKLK